MLIETLKALIAESQPTIEHMPPDVIADYQSLTQAVVEEDLQQGIAALEKLLTDTEDEDVLRTQFTELYRARFQNNQETKLDAITASENRCNVLYFNFAKALGITFRELLKIMLPAVDKEWIVELDHPAGDRNIHLPKKRRVQLKVTIHEHQSGDVSYLDTLPMDPKSFKHLVITDRHVLVLDAIELFHFELHSEFYRLLSEENVRLQRAIALHNESLGTLYSILARCQGDGISIREFIAPIVGRMLASGTRSDSGDEATLDGNIAATRLLTYYLTLPQALAEKLGQCKGKDGLHSFAQVIEDLKKNGCIEMASEYLQAILDNPVNHSVLNSSPNLSEDEKKSLCFPYQQIKSGTPLVDLNIQARTISLPTALVVHFYQEISLNDLDGLVDILTAFPTPQYLAFFREANLTEIDFEKSLTSVLSFLNLEQQHALIMALTDVLVMEKLELSASFVLRIAIKEKNMPAIQKILDDTPEKDYKKLLKHKDKNKMTALHHAIDTNDIDILNRLTRLYPDEAFVSWLMIQDKTLKTAFHHAANKPKILHSLIYLYLECTEGDDIELLNSLRTKDIDGNSVLHLAVPHTLSLIAIVTGIYRLDDKDKIALKTFVQDLQQLGKDGMSVLHVAAAYEDALCFLLEKSPNVKTCLKMLFTVNSKDESVVYAIFPRINTFHLVVNLLIKKGITDADLALIFSTSMKGESPLTPISELLLGKEGIAIMVSIFEQRPALYSLLQIDRDKLLRKFKAFDQPINENQHLVKETKHERLRFFQSAPEDVHALDNPDSDHSQRIS